MKLLFSQWYNNRSTCIFTSNASVDVVGNAVAPMVASRLKELCAIVPMPEIDYRENEPAPEEEIIQ
jgi:DNA replication protein DnaC